MNTSQQHQKITSRSLITFFLLAFGITWGFSALAAEHLLPGTIPAPLRNISGILLHYGPSLAAITLAGITGGRKALRSLLAKLGHWRVGLAWYLFVFLYPLLLRLAAVAIDVLLGGLASFFERRRCAPGKSCPAPSRCFSGGILPGWAGRGNWLARLWPAKFTAALWGPGQQPHPGHTLVAVAFPPLELWPFVAHRLMVSLQYPGYHHPAHLDLQQYTGKHPAGGPVPHYQ